MQLIRAVHKSVHGDRLSRRTHVPDANGKPVCQFNSRHFGHTSLPLHWILELGEQPSCRVCARQVKQVSGGAA